MCGSRENPVTERSPGGRWITCRLDELSDLIGTLPYPDASNGRLDPFLRLGGDSSRRQGIR
jgi:hypothetical protein